MKGLILSGGYGTRLRPLTFSQQKQLIPVANKPILFYGIEDLIEAGVKDIGIIVGPNKEQVIETVNSKKWNANIKFIEQDAPLGIAHTIKISKDFIGKDSFIMYLGDNILKEGVIGHVKKFKKSDCKASILLMEVDNPEAFGIAKLNAKKQIVKVLEKPKNPPSNLAVIGIYLFRSEIFDAVDSLKLSKRGQFEIIEAIQWLIDNKYTIESSFVVDWWKDTGKAEDILHANRLILDDITSKNNGKIIDSEIRGRIKISKDSVVEKNSIIKGPVIIGKNCKIIDSYIGPYTSIGDNCNIISTEIEDSVLMDGVNISKGGRIVDSLIGRDVKIFKRDGFPNGKKFVIGDNSEVKL